MPPTSRRVFLYWILLLVPTLAVGAVAIQLLRREQARIAEQSAHAIEARQAALAARARLIVENLELLVGDVQIGLLDALAEPVAEQFEDLAEEWETNNPLVRSVFLAREEGELLRPRLDAPDERNRGVARRLAMMFSEQRPWGESAQVKKTGDQPEASEDAARPPPEVTANVLQVQSARRDVQLLLKNSRNYAASPSAPSFLAEAEQIAAENAARNENERAARARRESPSGAQARDAADNPAKRGWTTRTIDGRGHVIGWVQVENAREIRGVEMELGALIRRLGDALPAETSAGEGFVLRDAEGRVLHQAGEVPRAAAPAMALSLGNAILPGWSVAAYLPMRVYTDADGRGFFWVGAVLVAILLAAILAGGSLLVRQARRSEQEAAQKTSFVANVSHEFKTPLTTIRLYAELLEQGRVRDAGQSGEYLRTIGRETQRLARLVNNVLDFSRLEQGRKKFAREPVDLTAELARLLETQALRLAEAGLRLERRLPEATVVVEADRDAIEQIVLNLIDNTAKYAADGGEVTVTLEAREPGGAEVRVGDRGPGVPAAHRERIFEKFHRVDETLTAEKQGAGLGLSIARQLARGMGGELRCVERAGGGAEFILELR